jgi:class 3 adenylate cyclase
MRTDEVVDTSGAPIGLGRRRAWFRVGVPVGGVALVIVAILAIALYSDRANRAGALALSQDLLDDLQSRVSVEVTANLQPAIRATRLVREIVERNAIGERETALESFAWSVLHQTPQVDALYSGDSDGNFVMVQRDEGQGTRTKLIRNMPGPRLVEWIRHDAEGRVTRREPDPSDPYDPRTRDWYQGALKADDVYWTSAYIFYTHREPGVTAAIRYHSEDGADHVFGVDITLKALSHFLGSLKIGHSGRAVIIDDADHLVAAPDDVAIMQERNGQFTPARLDELGASAMSAVYDRFRVEGYGRRAIEIGGVLTIAIASRLPVTGRDWTLLMAVPEADFTGFVASNGRKTLWLSLVVIALATGLAVLLVIQGLRADRSARLLLDRSIAIERQSQTFANLARQADLFDRSREAPLQALTAALGDLAAARRTSVWKLSEGGRLLHCQDACERDAGGHVAGVRLSRAELPQFFKALEAGDEIRVPDAGKDRRTVDFHRALMHPIDSRGLDVVPVRGGNNVVGAILLEDAAQMSGAREFAALFANVLAARMGDGMEAPTPTPEKANATLPTARERSLDTDLVVQGVDKPAPGAELFPSTAVMSIKFGDAAALAALADGTATLADRIAAALQKIAAAHHIPYVKLVGHDIVAAAGLIANDTFSLLRIADASIEARDRCLELFEAGGHTPSFRIGIACGLAVGAHVGQEPRLFNVWGDAVRIAELMAETSTGPGTIQVSEAAYAKLRAHFLFRPRGSFYLPRLGATQTFVLGSRQ